MSSRSIFDIDWMAIQMNGKKNGKKAKRKNSFYN